MAIVENIPPPGLGAALVPAVVGGSVVLSSAARQSNGIRKRMHHCLGWDAAAMLQMLQMLQLRSGPSDTTSARHLPIFCMLPPCPPMDLSPSPIMRFWSFLLIFIEICPSHNDIFSAFSNAALMNHCVGHQIQTNCYFSEIEMNFAYSSISGVSRAPQQ